MGVIMVEIPNKFPHMRPDEVAILKRYLSTKAPGGKITINFRYPIEPSLQPKDFPEPLLTSWIALNQKRSECVIETPSSAYIIEVKDRVNTQALGQLMNYRDLYRKFVSSTRSIYLVCVAREDDPQVRPSLEDAGIQVVIV